MPSGADFGGGDVGTGASWTGAAPLGAGIGVSGDFSSSGAGTGTIGSAGVPNATAGITPATPTPAPATPAVTPGISGGTGAGALAGPGGGGSLGTPNTPLATTLGGASPAATTGASMDPNLFGGDFSSGGLDFGGGNAATGATWTGAAPSSGLSGIGGTVGNWLMANPGIALGGALLGYEGLTASQNPPGIGAINAQARNLTTQGEQNLSAEQTGNIPGGAQAALNEAQQSAEAQIRSQYAQLGLSGSTMEAQAIAQVPQQIAARKFQIINQLTQTGLNEMGMADTLDLSRMNAMIQQDQQFQQSIAAFAAALAGGSAIHGFTSPS